jgi:hypothetical protein
MDSELEHIPTTSSAHLPDSANCNLFRREKMIYPKSARAELTAFFLVVCWTPDLKDVEFAEHSTQLLRADLILVIQVNLLHWVNIEHDDVV